jgi:hypothetical protein
MLAKNIPVKDIPNCMKIFFTLFISLISLSAISQISPGADAAKKLTTIQKDTVIESDTSKENKEPRYFYISPNVNVFVNTKGTAGKRVSPSCEFGRTYGIFDLGISIGTLNVLKGSTDTARYRTAPNYQYFSKRAVCRVALFRCGLCNIR